MTLQEKAVCDWLQAHEQDMLALLEEIVNIDSGSYCKAGVDRVGQALAGRLARGNIVLERFPLSEHGDCLLGQVPGGAGLQGPHVLLLGHMDTVFPEGTVARRPYRAQDGVAYGPGVADMKAGLVMNAFVAMAFRELGGNTLPLRLFFTGDEEIASPASRELTLRMAKGADAVLNAEPGRPTGNVVTGRKGAFFIDFEVQGVGAHAGVNHEQGASAIEAMARKISALHGLTDRDRGITTNVGTVRGGLSINTVAPQAQGQLDVRFPGTVDGQALRGEIQRIIEAADVPCTCGRVTHEGTFLPLVQSVRSQALLQDYQQAAQRLGFSVQGEFTGGSADSGLASSAGAATLCGTGPVGGKVHTPDEYCRIDTLVARAQAVALTVFARGRD
ncbi:M20 family metallopeptidase [Orrella sp. JC864]|uniref:M20 family metallopeptidase n=1 Tax=Orrella sp. JC864 TaxID=3120298 RepID=UPI00300A9EAC